MVDKLQFQPIIDGLAQTILIFDDKGRLVIENRAATKQFGPDLRSIRENGWVSAATLFDGGKTNPDDMLENIRKKAQDSNAPQPLRFNLYRSGEYLSCWLSIIRHESEHYTMLAVDVPEWNAVTELIDKFREEVLTAADTTRGHINLITRSISNPRPNESVEQLGKRMAGFAGLIITHMQRLELFMTMLERLEAIRIGSLRGTLREGQRRLVLDEFIEEFLEELEQQPLVDPQTDAQDHRSRLVVEVPPKLVVTAAPRHLTFILHDVLRNAIMYSMRATPIRISARLSEHDNTVEISVTDEGYGIRESESSRVWEPFARARQPQIIGEFGYGLSLYLCKQEVEAMNGRMWFDSDEGAGSTFYIKLPIWHDDSSAQSNASSSSQAKP